MSTHNISIETLSKIEIQSTLQGERTAKPLHKEVGSLSKRYKWFTLTYQRDISKPASCQEPIRSKAFPSSKAFPIVSTHHCPIALPSRPTYNRYIDSKCMDRLYTLHKIVLCIYMSFFSDNQIQVILTFSFLENKMTTAATTKKHHYFTVAVYSTIFNESVKQNSQTKFLFFISTLTKLFSHRLNMQT